MWLMEIDVSGSETLDDFGISIQQCQKDLDLVPEDHSDRLTALA